MRIRSLLAAAASLAALAGTALAEPARWVVRDSDSEITLFGTVHMLPKTLDWRTPAFESSFAAAHEVWFELDMAPAAQAQAQALVAELGLSPDRPLSTALTAQERARVKAAANSLGVPDAQLEIMRPWLAGLTLTMTQILRAGYDPTSGVERVLHTDAGPRATKWFETQEQQIRFFADLPDPIQAKFLMSAIDDLEDGPQELARMVKAWAEGDVAALEAVFLTEMRDDYPDLYEVIIKRRNEAWAQRIADELQGAGTDFIAVGAGHLVGPDSVQSLLAARGIEIERAP